MILGQTKHIIFIHYLSSYNLAVSQVDSCMCVCVLLFFKKYISLPNIFIIITHTHDLYHTYLYCQYKLYNYFLSIIHNFYFYIKENFCQKLVIKILQLFLTNMSCPLTRGHTHHHTLLHFYDNPTYSDREGGVSPNNQEWF